jgi:hypothetical protein
MKRLSMTLLMIGVLFVGAMQAQAAVVVVAGGPYCPAYYRPWHHHYWARPCRVVIVPARRVPYYPYCYSRYR